MTTDALRPIRTDGFSRPARAPSPGPAPMLQWIPIAQLVVDETYQRPIAGAGALNIRKIAEAFAWTKFAPVIVAPVEGGRYAVVDGQHRATAAALVGVEQVPCQVILAAPAEQAAAFRAINGAVTKMSALALHAAALAAGDAQAREIDGVCAAAGVTILRYPKAALSLKPGETLAIGAIAGGIRQHGRETVITALQCVTETANNVPGGLGADVILALCVLLGERADWRDLGGPLLDAFDRIEIEQEADEVRFTPRAKGVPFWQVLAQRLASRLTAELQRGAAA